MRFADIVRNMQLNVAANEVTPQRTGDNHPRDRGAQANQDHPAKVGVHLRRQQHRRRPGKQERGGGGHPGKQRDHQLHEVSAGMARHRESDADQQDNGHFEEQRQRADKTGKTNRIVRAVVAEGFEHLDGNLIDRPRFMQDLTEHRAERDDDRQEAQRTAHPFLHRRRDFIQRHAGEKTCTNRNHHQSHEGVHPRFHD